MQHHSVSYCVMQCHGMPKAPELLVPGFHTGSCATCPRVSYGKLCYLSQGFIQDVLLGEGWGETFGIVNRCMRNRWPAKHALLEECGGKKMFDK